MAEIIPGGVSIACNGLAHAPLVFVAWCVSALILLYCSLWVIHEAWEQQEAIVGDCIGWEGDKRGQVLAPVYAWHLTAGERCVWVRAGGRWAWFPQWFRCQMKALCKAPLCDVKENILPTTHPTGTNSICEKERHIPQFMPPASCEILKSYTTVCKVLQWLPFSSVV